MSKPTRGPDWSRPGALLASLGPWTPARGLGAAAAALVLVSVVSPSLGHGDARARVPTSAVPASAGSGVGGSGSAARPGTSAPSSGASSTPGVAAGPVSPGGVPTHGAGTTRVVTVPGSDSAATGRTVRFTVEVEDGAQVDEAQFAQVVRDVLGDQRGWETQDHVHFVSVSPDQFAAGEKPDVRITLASPDTVDTMCAPMDTEGQVSCNNGDRVALNSVRWTQGVPYYPNDLLHYRIYLVNHEVGHAIGHDHETCPADGRPAPVMLQQTLGLQGCTRYPWPVPDQQP